MRPVLVIQIIVKINEENQKVKGKNATARPLTMCRTTNSKMEAAEAAQDEEVRRKQKFPVVHARKVNHQNPANSTTTLFNFTKPQEQIEISCFSRLAHVFVLTDLDTLEHTKHSWIKHWCLMQFFAVPGSLGSVLGQLLGTF